MNCQELARILDERDLDWLPAAERSIAEAHLAECPDCARVHDLHRRLNALPVPALRAERIAGWRAVALSGAAREGSQRLRSRLVVIGTLIALAAAAALVVVRMHDAPLNSQAAAERSPISVATADEATTVPDVAVEFPQQEKQAAAKSGAVLPQGSFSVHVMPLQVENDHPAARTMGEEYYAKLLDQLRTIPGLILVAQDQKKGAAASPADYRLRITSGYGKVPERFGGHEQWLQNLFAEARKQPGTGSYTQVLGFSINPDCGRISPADLANYWGCTPAGMVDLGVQQLRRSVFPPDPYAARQLQARFLDTSLPQGVRRQALAELIELRQRSSGPMDAELIRVIINDAIANAPQPAQRANLWRALHGQSATVMVQPLIENLLREPDETVRLEMVGTLAAEFSADPAARAELEMVAKRDVKMLVRKVADRAISGEAAWRAYVVSTVKDANLPAAQRFEPLAWMAETRAMRPSYANMDAELTAIARQLFDDGEQVALADVLAGASNGATRSASGILQIAMSSVQHPAAADFLIAVVDRQADFSTFSLLGRHRADPRIEAKLKAIAANHPDPGVRQLAAAQLTTR